MNRRSLVLIVILVLVFPWPAFAGQNEDNTWTYSLKGDTEKSKRVYLLIYTPDKQERRVMVTSQCERSYHSEGTYGKCTHSVNIHSPSETSFKLETGEDVVLVQFAGNAPLILATIGYGCCGGSDEVKFYTEKGQYIGAIWGYEVSHRAYSDNVITRAFDMGNGIRYGNKIFLIINAPGKDNGFNAWVYDASGKTSIIPLLFNIPRKEVCEGWHVDKFVAYDIPKSISLKMNGFHCADKDDYRNKEQYFSCSVSDKAVNCQLVEGPKPKKTGSVSIKDYLNK